MSSQGMDSKFERHLHEAIMETCAKSFEQNLGKDSADHFGGQYFVMSPKLLTNLRYSDHVRVHIIFNGSKDFTHNPEGMTLLLRDIVAFVHDDLCRVHAKEAPN